MRMKREFCISFMMLVLSGFVLAASSEINVDFVVDVPNVEKVEPVSSGNSWVDYVEYFALFLILLVFIYLIKTKKTSKKVPVAKGISKKTKKKK